MRDRAILLLIAVLLLAGGAMTWALGLDLFGQRRHTLSENTVWTYTGREGWWLWPVAAGALALLALLALTALLRGLRTATVREINLDEPTDASGRTILSAEALTRAVATETETIPGVLNAQARLVGDSDLPRLLLRVTVGFRTDMKQLVASVEDRTIFHARSALDQPMLPVRLTVLIAKDDPSGFS